MRLSQLVQRKSGEGLKSDSVVVMGTDCVVGLSRGGRASRPASTTVSRQFRGWTESPSIVRASNEHSPQSSTLIWTRVQRSASTRGDRTALTAQSSTARSSLFRRWPRLAWVREMPNRTTRRRQWNPARARYIRRRPSDTASPVRRRSSRSEDR